MPNHRERSCFIFRQGRYRYKKGTTAVLSESVKKIEFDVVDTKVKPAQLAETMDTS